MCVLDMGYWGGGLIKENMMCVGERLCVERYWGVCVDHMPAMDGILRCVLMVW
jgi:hypothetical protein